jgi:competence ComEA-like helix-hairpin-helix protein
MNPHMGHNGKDRRLLVLLALGAIILLPNLNLRFPAADRPAGFYWLEREGATQKVFRASTPEQADLFMKSRGSSHVVISGNGDMTAPATGFTGKGNTGPGSVSPGLLFFLGRPLAVNRASAEELALVPGIGPVLAEKITAYRLENGPFDSRQTLLTVPGIGPRTASKISPYFSFE